MELAVKEIAYGVCFSLFFLSIIFTVDMHSLFAP